MSKLLSSPLSSVLEVEGTGEWFPVLQTTLLVGVSHSSLPLRENPALWAVPSEQMPFISSFDLGGPDCQVGVLGNLPNTLESYH